MLELKKQLDLDYCPTSLYLWQSMRTGLQVVLATSPTPVVKGHFVVGSEIRDDSGSPHTLEHLVFMGSKKYPFKGLLDVLGNVMLSNTNAWTAVDQTVYTLNTVGWESFGTLLPVYLDHVLHPTLTDSAYVTEVYHIDGDANEKGVVFSEMQGVENTSSSLITETSLRRLFSEDSPYSSNTGGLMSALRQLSNERIRQFHRDTYRPENLSVIVTGSVKPEDLIDIMQQFDDELPDRTEGHERPFIGENIRAPEANVLEVIEFPETDEEFGEMQMSWIGPSVKDIVINTALDVLGSYMTMEVAGKLEKALVDIPDPLATDVSYYTDDFLHTVVNFYLAGVPSDRLEEAERRVMEVFEQEAANFDMAFAREVVERKRNKFLLECEDNADSFADTAIINFLYGDREGQDLSDWTKDFSEFDTLLTWDTDKWVSLLRTYLIDNKRVSICGKPSAALYESLNAGKEKRINEVKSHYGESGLKMLGQKLADAVEENDRPIPDDVLASFKDPDLAKIELLETKSGRAGLAFKDHDEIAYDSDLQGLLAKDAGDKIPLYMHYEAFPSQFVTVRVYFSGQAISDTRLVPYVPLIFQSLFNLPMKMDNGEVWSPEEVMKTLKRETLESNVMIGGLNLEYLTVKLAGKFENYSKLVEWVVRALWNSVFDVERLSIILEKHLNSLADTKRDGSNVMLASIRRMLYDDKSLRKQYDNILTEEFAENALEKLKTDPQSVVNDLEKVRTALFTLDNMRILVAGGIDKIDRPVSTWSALVDASKNRAPLPNGSVLPVPRTVHLRSEKGRHPAEHAEITPVPATESSYLALVADGPSDYLAEDFAALSVAASYLQAVEGPFWRSVRGAGLAYGSYVTPHVEPGIVQFEVYRGSNSGEAILAALKTVEGVVSGATKISHRDLLGAKCSCVNSVVSSQASLSEYALIKYFDQIIRGLGSDYSKRFIEAVSKVSAEDMIAAMKKYILPVFGPDHSMAFAACHPSMVDELAKILESRGYSVTVREPVEDEDEDEDEDASDDEDDSEDED